MPRSAAAVFALSLLLASCSKDKGSHSSAVVRDSAGISIVENPTAAAAPEVVVDSLPVLTIGGSSKGPDYDFGEVRAAARLPSGQIAIADGKTSVIRFYDSTGNFLRQVGRKGQGPGEFQEIGLLWTTPEDSLLVYDLVSRRLSTFDPSGNFAHQSDLAKQGFLQPMGRLDDGVIVAIGFSFNQESFPKGDAAARPPQPVLLIPADSTPPDTLGPFPGIEMYTVNVSFGGRNFPSPMTVQFGHLTSVAGKGNRIYVGDNARYEIAVYDNQRKLLRLIRATAPEVPVTQPMREAQQERNLEQVAENAERIPAPMRDQVEGWIKTARYAERLPPFQQIRLDPDGNLWVQHFGMPDEPQRHTVFDSTGAVRARLVLPARMQLLELGSDYILGTWEDADGLPYVRVYRTPPLTQEVTASR
ncbi:MAG: 6-bladed beta-propeller [Gemmatimonadota bacterium]